MFEEMRVDGPYHEDGGQTNWTVRSFQQGNSCFLSVEARDMRTNRISATAVIPLDSVNGLIQPQVAQYQQAPPVFDNQNQDLADALRAIVDWRKNDTGVYVPELEPGSTIMTDTPGSSDVKILHPEEKYYERIPKKKMRIEEKQCKCPISTIVTVGCECGGFKKELAATS